jgi:electron transfer flavoprotein alpha subunit
MNDVVICVFAVGPFDKAIQGLAGAGRRLASDRGVGLKAIVLGANSESISTELSRLADEVVVIDQNDYEPESSLSAITHVCRQLTPGAVLFGNDSYSQEVTPRLAHRIHGSAVGDVSDLQINENKLSVTRQVYGGKAQATITLKRSPAVVWLRARSFAPAESLPVASTVNHVQVDVSSIRGSKVIERRREAQGEARLEEARVIVSGGRGIGGPEPFAAELKPLAELMGAQLAASRAACDAGWVPPTWQVGQTGKKVCPDLYLAIAITGASQHMAGISEAKNIAAINTDPDAPIFKHCRFGIVEDYRKVVPLLREKLEAIQNSRT